MANGSTTQRSKRCWTASCRTLRQNMAGRHSTCASSSKEPGRFDLIRGYPRFFPLLRSFSPAAMPASGALPIRAHMGLARCFSQASWRTGVRAWGLGADTVEEPFISHGMSRSMARDRHLRHNLPTSQDLSSSRCSTSSKQHPFGLPSSTMLLTPGLPTFDTSTCSRHLCPLAPCFLAMIEV